MAGCGVNKDERHRRSTLDEVCWASAPPPCTESVSGFEELFSTTKQKEIGNLAMNGGFGQLKRLMHSSSSPDDV